jgi:hypothetical protein
VSDGCKSLDDLYHERDMLKAELVELEKEICRHPEHVRGMFRHNPMWDLDRFEALIRRVTFARKLTTTTDADGYRHHGFLYEMDGADRPVTVRFHETSLTGEDAQETDDGVDPSMASQVWDTDDPVAWLEEHGVTDPVKQVGYLMYLTLREEVR